MKWALKSFPSQPFHDSVIFRFWMSRVCLAVWILCHIRPNCNKGLVDYAWFINRNSYFCISIFVPLYLSRFFLRYGGNAQIIKTELHYLHVQQSSFPLAATVWLLIITCMWENTWKYMRKKAFSVPLINPASAIPCCVWPLRLWDIACGTIPSSDKMVNSIPGIAGQ